MQVITGQAGDIQNLYILYRLRTVLDSYRRRQRVYSVLSKWLSLAAKIHVSETTAAILLKHDKSCRLELRGKVEVKVRITIISKCDPSEVRQLPSWIG